MKTFEFKNNQLYCKKCGGTNVTIKVGMTTDRYICKDCGNEEYD